MSALRIRRLRTRYGMTASQARLIIQNYEGGRA